MNRFRRYSDVVCWRKPHPLHGSIISNMKLTEEYSLYIPRKNPFLQDGYCSMQYGNFVCRRRKQIPRKLFRGTKLLRR